MRILFVLHHAGVTPFARTLGLLAERGHQVHVAFKRVKTAESARDLKQLADEFPAITFGHVPGGRRSEWDPLARKLRWKWGIPVNVALCLAFARWPLTAIIISTTSVLVAARNFSMPG